MKDPSGPAASEPGFRANLTGASLADLVQMECLTGTTAVVRVISDDEVGYLYFKAGGLVHAMTASAMGEAAALEILGWDRGSFEACQAGWPTTSTITKPWQALLMTSAAQRDESRRRTVLDFPRERGTSASPKPPFASPLPKSDASTRAPRASDRTPTSPSPAPPLPASDVAPNVRIEHAVRLDADGKVLSARGAPDELAAMTAYAMRLGALIGERLGMDALCAVECVTGAKRSLFYAEKNGNLIGLTASLDVELDALRGKLGLS